MPVRIYAVKDVPVSIDSASPDACYTLKYLLQLGELKESRRRRRTKNALLDTPCRKGWTWFK